ncbi:MAG: L-histidine N(alpha)-methyltransferase [Gemmatimonadales bacterium]
MAHAVAVGLSDTPRWLPSRYLYDARGSALFEEITKQPEYYLTRTEAGILEHAVPEIAAATGAVSLIELGSGYSIKTSHLLNAYTAAHGRVTYVPVDVSQAALAAAQARIAEFHPAVVVAPIVGRYEEAFPLLRRHAPAVVAFLGSTIGNFNHGESLTFWRQVTNAMETGDHFLLGVDLVKEPAVLEAAYNDAAGVTPAFTKNLFARLNRELDAGIGLDAIEHVARYNEEWQRIEISGRFRTAQAVHVRPLGLTIEVGAGERVMTEISRKFVVHDLMRYLACYGLDTAHVWTDEREWFAVLLLRKGEVGK